MTNSAPSTKSERVPSATFVPKSVTDINAFLHRFAGQPLDGRCLHEEMTSTGRWVCMFDSGHDGRHG